MLVLIFVIKLFLLSSSLFQSKKNVFHHQMGKQHSYNKKMSKKKQYEMKQQIQLGKKDFLFSSFPHFHFH